MGFTLFRTSCVSKTRQSQWPSSVSVHGPVYGPVQNPESSFYSDPPSCDPISMTFYEVITLQGLCANVTNTVGGVSTWLLCILSFNVKFCFIDSAEKRCLTIEPFFTRKSLDRGWAKRITALLDLLVSQDDRLPPHICSKCTNRVVTLERECVDLAAFKRSARASMEQAHRSLKRSKVTTGEVGLSPDTAWQRPRSKIARRLPFSSK